MQTVAINSESVWFIKGPPETEPGHGVSFLLEQKRGEHRR